MNPVIEMKHVKKAYDQNTIIEDLNVSIDPGEFVTIVGSSGCGKTK